MRRIWDFSGVGEIDYALQTRMPLVQIDVVYEVVLVIRRGIYDSIMFGVLEEMKNDRVTMYDWDLVDMHFDIGEEIDGD
jgi:hypothetical protein